MAQSKAMEELIRREAQRRAQEEEQRNPEVEHKTAMSGKILPEPEPEHTDTSDVYSRLKQNPLGCILKDQLKWVLASESFTDEQKKAARMIAICKTEELGGVLDYCENCDAYVDFRYRSCNNRNCPNCQYPMQEKWVEMRKNEIIPGIPYYHIILTCPHDLNPLFESNGKLLLGLLMRTSSRSILTMCKDPEVLGAAPSILSVLHTWNSQLLPHFHTHMLVSGGGFDKEKNLVKLTDLRAQQKRDRKEADGGSVEKTELESDGQCEGNDYFLPMTALTALFRDSFMANLREMYTQHELTIPACMEELNDPFIWSDFCYRLEQTEWVGDLEKTTAQGENVIEYFARYAYRTAISNSRIVSYDGEHVEFTVRDKTAPNGKKVLSLDARTFVKRFLNHILPKGFTRVRTYGILSNAWKTKNLISIHEQLGIDPYKRSPFQNLKGLELMKALFPNKEWCTCPYCHGPLQSHAFGKDWSEAEIARQLQRARAACN